jgi:hypothetical protein
MVKKGPGGKGRVPPLPRAPFLKDIFVLRSSAVMVSAGLALLGIAPRQLRLCAN